jgi:pyruvate/2-oxoglutarate dehydrogenase complex dihydrolipoamide acyltransferase (E2) component
MTSPIVLPELGAGDESVRVGGWLVEPGEWICAGDRLVELVLPGMTFDVSAAVSGRLVRIDKPRDSAVGAGDVLGWVEADPGGNADLD